MKATSENQQKEEAVVYKDTVYAKLRRALYNAVLSEKETQETQWDENGRCHMYQSFGDRGIIATMQRKANEKGWVVFFALCMYKHEQNHIPFIRDLKVRLTINETPSGVKLLWFVNGKPKWRTESTEMASYFHYTGSILTEVLNQIQNVYRPEDFVPILKYMRKPSNSYLTPYGLSQKWMNRLSKGTNPKHILNNIYGKDGQDGLTKNAFGSISKIHSLTTFAIASEVVRYLKSFPSSFFDKIILNDFGHDDVTTIGLDYEQVLNVQYFIKYFNNSKIQNDFVKQINGFEMSEHVDRETRDPAYRFFNQRIWQEAADSGRMFKQIKSRAIRKSIISINGTVQETHDLITMENAKLSREDKPIKYGNQYLALDDQRITDNTVSVLPKSTFDLILWGSQQHNCIGSYADRLAGTVSNSIIVGFKNKSTDNWVGHAELDKYSGDWKIRQLRGKYNESLEQSEYEVICKFLTKTIQDWS
jgi:hypothetical protein